MRYVLIAAAFVAMAGCQPKAQVHVDAKAPPMPAQAPQSMEEPARIQPLESVTAEPSPSPSAAPAVPAKTAAPVAAATELPETATRNGTITHTVTKTDTLWSLSKQYLGDPRRWQEIVNANPGLNPSQLKVGQKIVIPKR